MPFLVDVSDGRVMLVQNFCRYWPRVTGESLTTGPYVIKLTSSVALGDHLTAYNMTMQTKVLIVQSLAYSSPHIQRM